MKLKNYIFYLILIICSTPISGITQFTYFGFGLSQSNLTVNANRMTSVKQATALNTTQFHLGGLWRFNKFAGVGLDVGIPIFQKSKYAMKFFDGESPHSTNYGWYFDESTEYRYMPQQMDYTFKQSAQLKLIGRVFVGGSANVFVDLGVSALKFHERFVFERMAHKVINSNSASNYRPAVKAESIHEKHEQFLIVPGFAIGWQPHIKDRFFMNINLAYDFYMFKEENFSHWVPYLYRSYQNTTYNVRLASQLTKTKLAVTASVRFGMFF